MEQWRRWRKGASAQLQVFAAILARKLLLTKVVETDARLRWSVVESTRHEGEVGRLAIFLLKT